MIKIPPGIDVETTKTLLGVTSWNGSQLVRFKDALVQKLGGWQRMTSTPMVGTARKLFAWADLMGNPYAAMGSEQRLEVFYGGTLYDITPLRTVADFAPNFSTVINTPTVTITNASHGAMVGDWIDIEVQIAVGGLILQGFYQVVSVVDTNNYTITAAHNATATVNNGGATPTFTTTNASASVSVGLSAHGLSAGDNFDVHIAVPVANLIITPGNYSVVSVTNANVFVITPGAVLATAAATVSENGGWAHIHYLIPTGYVSATPLTGWGTGTWGSGPWGTSSGTQQIAPLRLWFLDNWGQDLVGNYNGSTLYTWSPPVADDNVAVPIGSFAVDTVAVATAQSGAGSYKPGDLILLAGGTFTSQASLLVETTKLVSATIHSAGAGGTDGAQTATGTTGNGTKFTIAVTVAGGAVTAVGAISVAGNYTVNPTNLIIEPVTVTGAGPLTGASLTIKMGVLTVTGGMPAVYSVHPTNPVVQASTSGSGTGATFTLTWTGGGTDVPQIANGSLVADPQQIMFAWGTDPPGGGDQDPNLVRWSDVGDNTDWLATANNQAGSFRISSGSRIVGMIQGPQFTVLWTDIDMWLVQYVGPPFVFTFNKIATGCDLISPNAVGVYQSSLYWVSSNNFFMYDGNSVRVIPCPVWDAIFMNFNRDQADKVICAVNSWFGEVMWFYPSASGTGEVDSYVKLTVTEGFVWDYGSLERTAWTDDNVFGAPMGVDGNNLLQQHETGYDADGSALVSWVESGYFSISEGTLFTNVERLISDFILTGPTPQVEVSFTVQDYPSSTPNTYGPFSYSQSGPEYSIVRARGRVASILIESTALGTFWRMGGVRYLGSPSGRR